jgi:2-dehydropantoate 2-reductase
VTHERLRICVVGAGTIGGLLAAHLAQVCQVSVLTRRPEQARALRNDGLQLSGKAAFIAKLQATHRVEDLDEPDLVVFACKGIDLAAAAKRIAGRFPAAIVLTVQNGLGAEEIVRCYGSWPLVSGFTFMSGTRHSDTHVEYVLNTPTWIGPYNGTPFEQVSAIATLFIQAGLEVVALADISPARWSKLIFNAAVNGVAALTGLPHDAHFAARESPSDLGHLVRDLMTEGQRVAEAAGVELSEDPWQMNVLATRKGASHYPSMLEDIRAGRATENELIGGAIVRLARELKVETPLHEALYSLVKAKESATLELGAASAR